MDSIPGLAGSQLLLAPADAAMMTFQRDDLAAVRRFTRDQASRTGLPERRLIDLVLAVNELATNAVVHTPGPGTVRIWQGGQAAGLRSHRPQHD